MTNQTNRNTAKSIDIEVRAQNVKIKCPFCGEVHHHFVGWCAPHQLFSTEGNALSFCDRHRCKVADSYYRIRKGFSCTVCAQRELDCLTTPVIDVSVKLYPEV